MEGASKHSKKYTDELPHPTRDRPYLGVVHVGWQLKCQSPWLLSICWPDILGTISTGQNKNTSTSSSKADRLLDPRATHRLGKGGRLRAQPLYQHLCVRGDTSRTHQSNSNNHQTSVRKEGRTLNRKAIATAAGNSSGCKKCCPDSGAMGADRAKKPWVHCYKRHHSEIIKRNRNSQEEAQNTTTTTR